MISYNELQLSAEQKHTTIFHLNKKFSPNFLISVSWLIDGASGGNCWGDAPYDVTPEPEPIDLFNNYALQAYYFLVGDASISDSTKEEYLSDILNHSIMKSDIEHEYYGNWSEYKYRYITIDKLYEIVYKYSREGILENILKTL